MKLFKFIPLFSGTSRSWNRLYNKKLGSDRYHLEDDKKIWAGEDVLWRSKDTVSNYFLIIFSHVVNLLSHSCKIWSLSQDKINKRLGFIIKN